MIYYFLLLNKHKNLSLRRKLDYKRNLAVTAMMIVFSIMPMIVLSVTFSKEDMKTFSVFLLPAIIILDFSLRFFFKKNTRAAIIPYLTLPIPRKILILYIIMSDLPSFWIWGCMLIYSIILSYFGVLTFWTTIILLFMVLINNYLIAFIKMLIGGYAVLTYPICLGCIFALLLICFFKQTVSIH